ncbi:MAG: ABC transporter permease [Halobacteriales archaeon]
MSLRKYVIKRTLVMIPVLFGVSVITFSLIQLLPGNVVDYVLQFQEASPELRAELEAQYHLDEPIWVQYMLWLRDALVLDFGTSPISQQPVAEIIIARIPFTFALGVFAWLIAAGIGIPAGIVAAVKSGELADETSRIGALLGIAMPNFWLGLILILIFAVELGWFRVIPPSEPPILSLPMIKFMILPAIALGTAQAALLMRLMRSSMVEELNKDYIRTARAKGLKERTVILKHALRNSLIAVVTVAALQIAFIVDGAVVIEQVFSWPGVGRLLIQKIIARDLPVLQTIVLMIASMIVFANLAADIIYAWLDPRIRY